MSSFKQAELDYLASQRLGRLATVDRQGAPQNSPVGFRYNRDLDTIDIYGFNMASSRKYRNIKANPNVSLVIDDIKSVQPWSVRGVEIRGRAEGVSQSPAPGSPVGAEIIRIHPRRVISWNV